MRMRTFYAALAICLSVTPAALGQTPGTKHVSGSGDSYVKPKPQETAIWEQVGLLVQSAAISLHAGRYADAEAQAREALSLRPIDTGEEVLAAALDAQGKNQEALQAYKKMVVDEKTGYLRVLLPYALLLLKSGQWGQAVGVYNQTLSPPGAGDFARANSRFSPDVPEPAALAVALHIVLGQEYSGQPDWAGESQNREAMAEYAKALRIAPNDALVNYHYGTGWQRLTPAEKAKFGNAAQARAALQKAANLGGGDVKKNAEEALKAFAPPR